MKTILTLCIILITAFAKAQTVTTITEGLFFDGLGITSNGDVYCSNFQGDQVFKYEYATADVTTFATGLVNPNGIGVTNNDHIYVCEAGAGTIRGYDTSGNLINSKAGLNNPTGVKYNPNTGELLWVSYNQSSINVLNLDTNETSIVFQGAPLNGPSGIAFIGDEVFISNYNDRKIFRLEDNNTVTQIAQLPATASQNNVLGFLTSKDGLLFGTQIGEHRIYSIDPTNGEINIFAGSSLGNNDGNLDDATFNFPNGILGDNTNDRLYISDAGTSNLRIIENVTLNVDAVDKENIELRVYSDTSSIQVEAVLPLVDTYTLKIYNSLGKLIEERVEKTPTKTVKTSIESNSWSNGVYILQLTSGAYNITEKILK